MPAAADAERSFGGCRRCCRRLVVVSSRSSARKLALERSGRTRREPPRTLGQPPGRTPPSLGRLGGVPAWTIARAICSVWGRDLRPRSRAALAVYLRCRGRARLQLSLLAHGRTTVLLVKTRTTPAPRTAQGRHRIHQAATVSVPMAADFAACADRAVRPSPLPFANAEAAWRPIEGPRRLLLVRSERLSGRRRRSGSSHTTAFTRELGRRTPRRPV